MMFKFSISELPIPVLQLFSRNSEIHNYNTRGNKLLRTKIGSSEATYANLAFMLSTFGTLFQRKYPLTSLTAALNISLNILYKNMILNIG